MRLPALGLGRDARSIAGWMTSGFAASRAQPSHCRPAFGKLRHVVIDIARDALHAQAAAAMPQQPTGACDRRGQLAPSP